MNRAVVRRAARALAEWLMDAPGLGRSQPVVVGHDARLSSKALAEEVAGTLLGAGLSVRWFSNPVPTPWVAFAVGRLGACAGVVVTASHNPSEYNGIKLYGADGIQLSGQQEEVLGTRMARLGPAKDIPVRSLDSVAGPSALQPVGPELFESYATALGAIVGPRPRCSVPIVYSAMHGVGGQPMLALLRRFGHQRVEVVTEQQEPDGNFPTAPSPNPEDPAVLERAFSLARGVGAALLLATDPDADRLAVAIPTATGRWRALSGDETGALLAEDLLDRALSLPQPLVVSTIVSSPLVELLARARGAHFERTLTGFKWIWRAGAELEAKGGLRWVFGYEEAIGFSALRSVRDKDGLSAAVLLADLAARCAEQGSSLWARLVALWARHGLWISVGRAARFGGPEGQALMMASLESLVTQPPLVLGGRRVTEVIDWRQGASERAAWLGATAAIEVRLAGGSRVILRPSGTEPKLKFYGHWLGDFAPHAAEEREATASREALAVLEEVGRLLNAPPLTRA